MTVASDPERDEVLGYMRRTGSSPIEAVRHFFPGISPEDQRKKSMLYSKWQKRHGGEPEPTIHRPQGPTPQAQGAQQQRPAVVAPSSPALDLPDPTEADLSGMTTVAYYEWRLQHSAACLRVAHQTRDLRLVMAAGKEMDEVRGALDRTRAQQGRVTKLERTPAAVAAEMSKRQKALAVLAEAAKVREAGKEREL